MLPTLQALIGTAVMLLLTWRAASSADPFWRRATAMAIVIAAVIVPYIWTWMHPPTGRLSAGSDLSSLIRPALRAIEALYLLSWSIKSRDTRTMRVASAVLGLLGAGQLIFFFLVWLVMALVAA